MGDTVNVVDLIRNIVTAADKADGGADQNTANPANGDFGVVKGADGKHRVHKLNKNGNPQGGAMGSYDNSDDAQAHADKLNKAAKNAAKGSKKGYGDGLDSDDFPAGYIDQDDARAQYDPIGGLAGGGKACANCHWFLGSNCLLVQGQISPTGLCNLWLTQEDDDDNAEQKPMPVIVVGQEESGPSSDQLLEDVLGVGYTTSGQVAEVSVDIQEGGKSDDSGQKFAVDKTDKHPAKLKLNNKAQIEGAITALTTGQYRGNKITPALTDEEKKTAKGRIKTAISQSGESDDWKKQELARLNGKSDSGSKEIGQPSTWLGKVKTALGLGPLPAIPEPPGTMAAFKALDNGRWVAWWTNGAKDKHGEVFPSNQIEAYIARADKGIVPMPELWYRHMSVPHGQADWLGHVGKLTLAAGHFYDTEVGKKFYAHYKAHGDDYTVSHGYFFDPALMTPGGVYGPFNTYEISPTYAGEESNALTGIGVKELEAMITPAKKADLEKIIGPEFAARYIQFGEQKTKELEALGVKFKSFEDPNAAPAQAAGEAVDAVAREATTAVASAQKDLGDAFQIGMKALLGEIEGLRAENKALGEFLKEQYQLAPRATQALQTQLNPTNPYLTFLATKNADPANNLPPSDKEGAGQVGGVMGVIMGMLEKHPNGQ